MNKYLVKLAEIVEDYSPSWSDTARGALLPAWGRRSIAQKHGFTEGGNWGQAISSNIGGYSRQVPRMIAEGAAGELVGSVLGPAGMFIGGTAGALHGSLSSVRNQLREYDQEFAAKAALLKARQSEKG
jgi:hypothetical protein